MNANSLFFIALILLSTACQSNETSKTNSKNLYEEKGEGSFEITRLDSVNGYHYRSTDVSYNLEYLQLKPSSGLKHYFSKLITERISCISCEAPLTKISFELRDFEHPKTVRWKFEADCNDLKLFPSYFKTTKYACCGAEDEIAIYGFDKKIICKGHRSISKVEIPNSNLAAFIGYETNFNFKEKSNLGILHLGFNDGTKFDVLIQTRASKDDFPLFAPEIRMSSEHEDDEFDQGKQLAELWSAEDSEDYRKINGLRLELIFEYGLGDPVHLVIPIEKGAPFGKNIPFQKIYLD